MANVSSKPVGKIPPYETSTGQYYEGTVFPTGETVVASVTVPLATRLDEASATVTYVGKAKMGSADASAVWQIQKISVSGNVTSITWADSNSAYDNVWNNRASLTYG